MPSAKLRKVGGSTMLAIPPALANELRLGPGANVDLTVDDGKLIVKPARKRYKLADLLAQCDHSKTVEGTLCRKIANS